MSVVEVRDLRFGIRRHFWAPRQEILRGVTFSVPQGEIFGFLGPNGAGKTTTIKSMLDLVRPQSGEVKIFGHSGSNPAVRMRVGFMPERAYYPEHLTAREFMLQHGVLAGLSLAESRRRTQESLRLVQLTDREHLRLAHYSKGMLQRLGIAQAMIGQPDLVVLDEPLAGLDPVGRRDIREIMLQLRAQGKTVFFSTHILHDVEMICDRVAILVAGRVKKVGLLHKLVSNAIMRIQITAEHVDADTLLKTRSVAGQRRKHEDELTFDVQNDEQAGQLIDILRAAGATIRHVETHHRSLEDVFMTAAAADETGA